MRKKLVFVTGTRAEFGLLTPVLRAASASARLEVLIYATGTHPIAAFGNTIEELHASGFAPHRVIDILVAGDSPAAMGKSIGLATISLIDALSFDRPDAVVVLGDRFEILAVATAAMSLGIPLVHLEGGHVTEGAIDDSIRHAVTKMARLHFTAAAAYGQRIIQMGEDPAMVHVVGATGLDNILSAPQLSRAEIAAWLKVSLDGSPLILATHHPVTTGKDHGLAEIQALLTALEAWPEASVVFTSPNADPGNAAIHEAIEAYVRARPERRALVASLGFVRYLSLVRESDLVIGNSSSGLIEVPSLGVPTVNIGPRQKGRLRAPSVIDVAEPSIETIQEAIRHALSPGMRALAAKKVNPMGNGTAGAQIVQVLEATDFAAMKPKAFYDLPGGPVRE